MLSVNCLAQIPVTATLTNFDTCTASNEVSFDIYLKVNSPLDSFYMGGSIFIVNYDTAVFQTIITERQPQPHNAPIFANINSKYDISSGRYGRIVGTSYEDGESYIAIYYVSGPGNRISSQEPIGEKIATIRLYTINSMPYSVHWNTTESRVVDIHYNPAVVTYNGNFSNTLTNLK